MKLLTLLFSFFFFISCSKQEARKPISYTNGSFIKESIKRNKALIVKEEGLIKTLIKKDSTTQYFTSEKGYWYAYQTKINESLPTPKTGDIAFFDYDIKNLSDSTIYTKEELQPQKYLVDKEEIMQGLRSGIKLMKKGETVTFLFPSHIAYGYHGDKNKIGTNIPIICTVTINDIIHNKENNKQ